MNSVRDVLRLGHSQWTIDTEDGFFKPRRNNLFKPWT